MPLHTSVPTIAPYELNCANARMSQKDSNYNIWFQHLLVRKGGELPTLAGHVCVRNHYKVSCMTCPFRLYTIMYGMSVTTIHHSGWYICDDYKLSYMARLGGNQPAYIKRP